METMREGGRRGDKRTTTRKPRTRKGGIIQKNERRQ
jgi:hypothetical protein